MLAATLTLIGCNDDDDITTPESSAIFDKWWYAEDVLADFYISSNGEFEQNDGSSTSNSFFGEWTWVDESELTLKVEYLPGRGLGQPERSWLRFSNLTETTVSVEQSLTGQAGSYAGPFEYSTVE